ncbi:Ptr3p [Kluyveromyces lactis]|uniref:KLLA0F02255p n=1 Tax=Kluyveromyces lactis (strain ATCC 8585 / CBS 2359 / DSM 70799 / NBRC 1267 / NRRL Y-1140 / WM37) TaxID=284590 RepID=Q6CLK7_KLULA|nr:uncharacterized protein KLLA0_F02255g [Kluyveromyces lactis]CAG97889.1 KLLA0F02255p [Kluyveromyces lactis]|eukprot:XP_455182.1 uncharacterized protein KLLA0_F02255g [Kluyveromyces lactis]
MSIEQILKDLEQNLFLPSEILRSGNKISVKYRYIDDAYVQSCGCIMSEQLSKEIQTSLSATCPVCHTASVTGVGPVGPLRHLYDQLRFYQNNKPPNEDILEDPTLTQSTERSRRHSDKSHSLLSLFLQVASKVATEDEQDSPVKNGALKDVNDVQNFKASAEEPIAVETGSLDNISNSKTIPIQDNNSSMVETPLFPINTATIASEFNEEKEYYFAKCFPMYRKRSQFNTHSKFLRTKSKLFINNSISPDCTKFALITPNKWEVFSIPSTNSGSKNKEPELLFCGNTNGEFGPNFESLSFPQNATVLQPIYNESWDAATMRTTRKKTKDNSAATALSQWEHIYCKLSNRLLVVAGTRGIFRVFNLSRGGEPIYTYCSSFPIRSIDINPITSIVSCGITGRDRTTGSEQALLLFHRFEFDQSSQSWQFPQPITITLPYRDPIHTLQFSSDGKYLSCSTALESRFLVISLRKINEPRLVMKSLRSLDTSLESEGITDTKLFPGNPNLMCVTSVAFNAPPIVINTKIESINGVQSVAQPTMLLRLDELGSKIHKCEISPRNDSIAFLDRNGTVNILFAPTMMDNEKRRILTVDVVSNAYRMREAASMRFSVDGHTLYILDRKGILYVEDFAFALPQHPEVTKCKQIN